MKLKSFPNAAALLAEAQEFLEQEEATNNVTLGVLLQMARSPEPPAAPPYLAVVSEEGRIVLVAMITAHPLVISSNGDVCDSATDLLAQDLLDSGRRVAMVMGPCAVATDFAATWARLTGVSYRVFRQQRVHELRHVAYAGEAAGHLRPATPGDTDLVTQWVAGFNTDIGVSAELAEAAATVRARITADALYLWEDGGTPVSMAAKIRPTAHGIAVGMVYTPPELRGCGYATSCVAQLSQLLLASGRQFCALYTDLANPISNHIYARIGYRPVGDSTLYRFD